MSNEKIIVGGAGVVVGAFIGLGIGGALVGDKIDAAVARALEPVQEMVDSSGSEEAEAIAALTERFEALEAQLAESAGRTSEISTAARDQLESIEATLSERIDSVVEAAGAQAQDLRAAVEGMIASARESVAAPQSETAETTEVPEDLPPGDAVSVGKTAIFADGAVRAFVSRLEDDAARLSVNGETVVASVGDAVPVSLDAGDCAVVLQGVSGDGAVLTSDCGGAPSGASASVPEAPESGFRPGEVATLADGALRVFVSGMAADGSAARIAINGVEMQTVEAGSSVTVDDCQVTVTGVGDGLVGLEGSCG